MVIAFRETTLSAFWNPASDALRSRCLCGMIGTGETTLEVDAQ